MQEPQPAHDGHVCARCGRKLGWFHHGYCKDCEQAVQAEQLAARERYVELLGGLADPQRPVPSGEEVRRLAAATGWPADRLEQEAVSTARSRLDAILADDLVSEPEHRELAAAVDALGLEWSAVLDPAHRTHLLVGMINAGAPPSVESPRLLTQPGETVWYEAGASLLKQVDVREFQGGSSGFSLPLGHTGIRYRIGGFRGHSVVVGTRQVVDDRGTLCVSSARVVFLGGRRTIEVPYRRLAGVTLYTDGLRLNVTGRQSAPVLQMVDADVDVAAALIQLAMRPPTQGAAGP